MIKLYLDVSNVTHVNKLVKYATYNLPVKF